MIDDSDGDTFWLISVFSNRSLAIIALIIAVVLWCIAAANSTECEKSNCPIGMTAKLLDHACVCVSKPTH
jgi:hypothetical protein